MKKKIIVTGASGNIGRIVIKKLVNKGFEVHAFSRKKYFSLDIIWHKIDLFKKYSIEKKLKKICATHLLHLAWNTETDIFWNADDNLEWLNSSIELLKNFKKNGGRRIVIAGSCAEYDWSFGWCDEKITPLRPRTLYGNTKNALHSVVSSYCEKYNISNAWARIFFLFGGHENKKKLIPSVINSLLNKKIFICRNGNFKRDFIHVEDIALCLVEILINNIEGPVNISSAQPIKIKDVLLIIAKKMNCIDLIKFNPNNSNSKEPVLVAGNNKILKNQLSWKGCADFEESIENTISFWKRN